MSSYKVSWNWIPIVDNNRYKPLPVSVVFLQNAFDVVFLFAFIQFWNWGPLLVVLYYIIETLVMTFFATLKWSKKSSAYSDSTLIHNSLFKWIFIVVIHATVGVFSYAQIDTIHEVLGLIISIPPWEVLLKDDKQFLIGVFAIILQQAMDYYKHSTFSEHNERGSTTVVLIPMVRVFIQQAIIMLGILFVLALSTLDAQLMSIFLALFIGGMKLLIGQIQLVIVHKQ